LRDSENFNELFLRRKEIQKAKKEMKDYLKNLNMHAENKIFDDIKEEVVNRI
jgi:predicted enzyme involved in methoxymalonyl-ACP biosynthesis